MLWPEKLLQPTIWTLRVVGSHGVVPLEHRWGLAPRKLHDHWVVNLRLPHVDVAGTAQIMKPEVDDSCLPAGIDNSLLDLLEGFSLISQDVGGDPGIGPSQRFSIYHKPDGKGRPPGALRFWYFRPWKFILVSEVIGQTAFRLRAAMANNTKI